MLSDSPAARWPRHARMFMDAVAEEEAEDVPAQYQKQSQCDNATGNVEEGWLLCATDRGSPVPYDS